MNNILLISENCKEKFSLGVGEYLYILSLNSQNEIEIELKGEGAVFEYRSLVVSPSNKNNFNQIIKIFHNASNTKSFLFARNILGGSSKSHFKGIVEVGKNCTSIKSRQAVNSLLLSRAAKSVSEPELKIYCDDVECSHGATCGNLSGEDLFYLQSRGVSAEQAEKILLDSFAREVAAGHNCKEQKKRFLSFAAQQLLSNSATRNLDFASGTAAALETL